MYSSEEALLTRTMISPHIRCEAGREGVAEDSHVTGDGEEEKCIIFQGFIMETQ